MKNLTVVQMFVGRGGGGGGGGFSLVIETGNCSVIKILDINFRFCGRSAV